MLSRFRLRRQIRNRNRAIVDDLYDGIVSRSRRPSLFVDCGLPDTVMGRFESLAAHVFLVLSRCGADERLKPVAQDLVDRFVTDVEDSIREIGIGDIAVPKRMRKLAGRFYERVAAYDPPLRAGDAAALAGQLERLALANADPERRDAAGLAGYMLRTKAELDAVDADAILSGRMFKEAGEP